MNLFTEVYSSLVNVLQTKSLESSWGKIEADLKQLCQTTGPDATKSDSLHKSRKKIEEVAGKAYADSILKAAQVANAGFQKRAAMLKTFKHFYFVTKRGNQSVWVVDHPKAYNTWAFDQLDGKTERDVKGLLQKEEEVFGSSNRKMMSDSLQLARKWSMDVMVKLGKADARTLTIIKRWFHSEADTEQQVKATAAVLLSGVKKIADTCNSTSVIFSDRPHLRTSGDWDETFASVNAGDAMPVIYLFQVFLDTGKRNWFGNVPKLWLCALTVIHELSHKLVKTEDISYDYQGLKPGGTITPADALKNADSWAYFCANLVGALSAATIKDVLK